VGKPARVLSRARAATVRVALALAPSPRAQAQVGRVEPEPRVQRVRPEEPRLRVADKLAMEEQAKLVPGRAEQRGLRRPPGR
jgi:hypothetical protein